MNERSSVEKGILPEVLPRTQRAFSLSMAGEFMASEPIALALKDTTQPRGDSAGTHPECFKHAAWPQIHFMGVLTSPTSAIQPLTWMLWLQLNGESVASLLMLVNRLV